MARSCMLTAVHVILGLPNESENDMLETVKYVCESGANGIKLQLLHVIDGTDRLFVVTPPEAPDELS